MKIRVGYVSNSSSSSFLVFGEELRSLKDVFQTVEDGKSVHAVGKYMGGSGECADLLVRIDARRLEFMKEHRLCKGLNYILSEGEPVCLENGTVELTGEAFVTKNAYQVYVDYNCPMGDDLDFVLLAARGFPSESDGEVERPVPLVQMETDYCFALYQKMDCGEAVRHAEENGKVLDVLWLPDIEWEQEDDIRPKALIECDAEEARILSGVIGSPSSKVGAMFCRFYEAVQVGRSLNLPPGKYSVDSDPVNLMKGKYGLSPFSRLVCESKALQESVG